MKLVTVLALATPLLAPAAGQPSPDAPESSCVAFTTCVPFTMRVGEQAPEDVVQTEEDAEVLESRKKFEEAVGRELESAWSRNFLVVVDTKKPFKFGKQKLAGRELAAEVVRYCEPIFDAYCERFGAKPEEDFRHRTEVLLWEDEEDHLKVARDVLEWTPGEDTEDWPTRRGGDRGSYSLVLGSDFAKDSATLERRLVHAVTRSLFSTQAPSAVMSTTGNCWLSLGVGMLAEDEHCGSVSSVDRKTLLEELPRKPNKWRGAVRKLVEKEKIEEFQDLVQRTETQFDGDAALVAVSLVDFLLAKDLVQFREFCLHMKSRTPTRDAVQVVYGWRDDEFEEAWSAWVLETYPKR